MRIQEKQKALEQEVIANLCAIPKMGTLANFRGIM